MNTKKVVILAGGYGTRLSEYTKLIPKPMIEVKKGKPLITYIMDHYFKYGFREFYIALGYKGEYIKKYFKNNKKKFKKFKLHLVSTGLKTYDRWKAIETRKIFKKEPERFLLTYGDGVSNVNIKKLYDFHKIKGQVMVSQKKYGDLNSCKTPCKIWSNKNKKKCTIIGSHISKKNLKLM